MITMAYNPVRDNGILKKEYNWSYDVLDICNMDKQDIKNNILLLHILKFYSHHYKVVDPFLYHLLKLKFGTTIKICAIICISL